MGFCRRELRLEVARTFFCVKISTPPSHHSLFRLIALPLTSFSESEGLKRKRSNEKRKTKERLSHFSRENLIISLSITFHLYWEQKLCTWRISSFQFLRNTWLHPLVVALVSHVLQFQDSGRPVQSPGSAADSVPNFRLLQ